MTEGCGRLFSSLDCEFIYTVRDKSHDTYIAEILTYFWNPLSVIIIGIKVSLLRLCVSSIH